MKQLLAENVNLKLELKNIKTLLNDRKTRKIEKKLVLKERIVISMNKVLILFEKIEVVIQNKKKKLDKSYERSRKNVVIEFIMISEEVENEERIFEDDDNEKEELKL